MVSSQEFTVYNALYYPRDNQQFDNNVTEF